MLLSHRFGSVETLSRARYWLTRHGFEIAPTESSSHDVSRLSLNIPFSQAAAALALIDSIEGSDPNGWPGVHDRPKTLRAHGSHMVEESQAHGYSPTSTPIHWHKHEEVTAADPVCCKVCEYMLSRWE